MNKFKSLDIKQVVVSNSPMDEIKAVISKTDLNSLFDQIISNDIPEVKNKKPAPECISICHV